MSSLFKTILNRLITVALVFLALWCGYASFVVVAPIKISTDTTLDLTTENIPNLSQYLSDKGLIRDQNIFNLFVTLTGYTNHFKVGQYILTGQQNFFTITHRLAIGPETREKAITIVEGWTATQMHSPRSSSRTLFPGRIP